MLEFIPTLTYNNSVSTGNVLLARFEINLCYYYTVLLEFRFFGVPNQFLGIEKRKNIKL